MRQRKVSDAWRSEVDQVSRALARVYNNALGAGDLVLASRCHQLLMAATRIGEEWAALSWLAKARKLLEGEQDDRRVGCGV